MTDERALRRFLLEMACGAEPVADDRIAARTDDDWALIERMCVQHRLGPLMYSRYGAAAAVPEAVRDVWRAAHRYWACSAMAQKLDLDDCSRVLTAQGFAPIALKGAFLAWHAYPEPALRPLRDLDVLVAPEATTQAFAALREAGYTDDVSMHDAHSAGSDAAETKHLDPLVAPHGSVVELHRQLWESDGALDHHSPGSDAAALRARATTIGGIAYPAPEDTFVHLIVHAVYSHRLDCGPLLLWDLRHLLPHLSGDWDTLWSRARREGWERGAVLVLALMRRYFGDGVVPRASAEPAAPSDAMVEVVIDLLLQDLDTRRSAAVAASAITGGKAALRRRLAGGRKHAGSDSRTASHTFARFAAWFTSRARRTAGELAHKSVRRQARGLAQLSAWLET